MVLEDSFFDILKYKELEAELEERRKRSEEYVRRTREKREKKNPKPQITRLPSKKRTKKEQEFYDKKRQEFHETPLSSGRTKGYAKEVESAVGQLDLSSIGTDEYNKLDDMLRSNKYGNQNFAKLGEMYNEKSAEITKLMNAKNIDVSKRKELASLIRQLERLSTTDTTSAPRKPTDRDVQEAKKLYPLDYQNMNDKEIKKKLNRLYKEKLREFKNMRTKSLELNSKINDMFGDNPQMKKRARKIKNTLKERRLIHEALALKQIMARVKSKTFEDVKGSADKEKRRSDEVPLTIRDYIFPALSQNRIRTFNSAISELNTVHADFLKVDPAYDNMLSREYTYKGKDQNDLDRHLNILYEKADEFVNKVNSNTNGVERANVSLIKDIENQIDDIKEKIESKDKNEEKQIENTIIDDKLELIKTIKKTNTTIKRTKKYLQSILKDAEQYHNDFVYRADESRTDASILDLLYILFVEKQTKESTIETFEELEYRGFFTPENLYKVNLVISRLRNNEVDLAKKVSRKNKFSNHEKMIDLLIRDIEGKKGWEILLDILRERRISLPDLDVKDSLAQVAERRKKQLQLTGRKERKTKDEYQGKKEKRTAQEIIDSVTSKDYTNQVNRFKKVFRTPTLSDDLRFLTNARKIQDLIDLAERQFNVFAIEFKENPDTFPENALEEEKRILGKLYYIAKHLNGMSKDTTNLKDIGGQFIIPNNMLEKLDLTYSSLEDKHGPNSADPAMSEEVKEELEKQLKIRTGSDKNE